MKKTSNGFTLIELLVVIAILGTLMVTLFPAITSAMLKSNLSASQNTGRKLYQGIFDGDTYRKTLGKCSLWPRSSENKSDDTEDIGGTVFGTSTEYFKKLFDVENIGTEEWDPYVRIETSVLYGQGVPSFKGKNLQAANVSWAIAQGVTDDMIDDIPVLCTRNVSTDNLKIDSYDGVSTEKVPCGKKNGGESDTPFADKAWVVIRKGGAAQAIEAKYSKLNDVYNSSFTLPTDAGFKYLKVGL